MPDLDLVVLLLSTITMALLGAIVLFRNVRNITFWLFGVVALISILWSAANYTTNHVQGYQWQLFANRLSLFIGFLLIQAVWLLSLYFPHKISKHSLQLRLTFIVTPVILFITLFTRGVVDSVVYRPEKNITDINIGSLFNLYIFAAVLFFILLIFNFYKSYRAIGINQIQKQQILYASIGLGLAFVWAVATAVVIPSATNNWEISKYGAVGSLFLVGFISYAIIKHKLFDIRLVFVRSIGYVLSLLTIGAIAFLVLSTASVILEENNISQSTQRFMYVALTMILAISYLPFRRLFDRLTKRLFYRDAYETQALLNEFNETIVSTIDLEQLLERSGVVIEKYIKSDQSAFAIRDSEGDTIRLVSAENPRLSKEVIEQIRGYVHKSPEKLFVTDALEEGDSDLKMLLQESNIGLLARITTDPAVEGAGYVVLGYKKSGNLYNSQDTAAMEIMSNELAIAMQNALQFEEIQKFNVTLQEKVDDATRKLRKSNDKLKQMDETKDEFISMASHQLRTPLTSVKGYVSMVIEGDAGELNPMQKKLLDQAFTSSQRMVYLIADLLNVSRLRTGKFVIDAIPSNLADVVKGEVDQLVETAASRNLELTYEKPDDFPELLLDETKVRQVIMNFIDNAIYYTPSGGHIRVELKDTGSTVEYTVTDDGLGVPKSEQHHLFTKFYRAGNAKKARPDGTGLGLFMAKKVIVAQGGSLIFKSTEGKGSTFGFTFDKEKLKVPEHYVAPEELNGIKFGPNTSSVKDTK